MKNKSLQNYLVVWDLYAIFLVNTEGMGSALRPALCAGLAPLFILFDTFRVDLDDGLDQTKEESQRVGRDLRQICRVFMVNIRKYESTSATGAQPS